MIYIDDPACGGLRRESTPPKFCPPSFPDHSPSSRHTSPPRVFLYIKFPWQPTLYLLVHNRSWHNLALNTYFSHQHCFSRENSNFKLWQNNNIATVSSCHPSSMFDLGSCFPKTCILIISSSQTEILWKRDQGWILIVFKYCGQKPTNAMLVPSNVRST